MRLETLQKQVEDQQEHICVLRDTVSLKDRQADMLHSDVMRSYRYLSLTHTHTHTHTFTNPFHRKLFVPTGFLALIGFLKLLLVNFQFGPRAID